MSGDTFVNYYELLGVSETANADEIKKKWLKLALKYHPDKSKAKNAQEVFIRYKTAYDTLGNDEKRENYDQVLRVKHLKEHRYKEMDDKKRKMKDDLERKEQEALNKRKDSYVASTKKVRFSLVHVCLLACVCACVCARACVCLLTVGRGKRKRKETRKQNARRRIRLMVSTRARSTLTPKSESVVAALKVTWEASESATHQMTNLHKIFERFGNVGDVSIREKKQEKPMSAMITFVSVDSEALAHMDDDLAKLTPQLWCKWIKSPSKRHAHPLFAKAHSNSNPHSHSSHSHAHSNSNANTNVSQQEHDQLENDILAKLLARAKQTE
jgi:hypothetical protein